MTVTIVDDEKVALRAELAEMERKYNYAQRRIENAVAAFKRGDDLTRTMYALEMLSCNAGRWDRELVIEKLQEWVAMYGDTPSASEWNPALARRNQRPDMVGPFLAGDWPHASTVQRIFGSWNAALVAAGLPTRVRGTFDRRMKPGNYIDERWPVWTGWKYMRAARRDKGMTQSQVADATFVSVGWISRAELGLADNIMLRALLSYSRVIGIPAAAFLDSEESEASRCDRKDSDE